MLSLYFICRVFTDSNRHYNFLNISQVKASEFHENINVSNVISKIIMSYFYAPQCVSLVGHPFETYVQHDICMHAPPSPPPIIKTMETGEKTHSYSTPLFCGSLCRIDRHTHTFIYIYIYVCVCVCIYVCVLIYITLHLIILGLFVTFYILLYLFLTL